MISINGYNMPENAWAVRSLFLFRRDGVHDKSKDGFLQKDESAGREAKSSSITSI